MTEVEFVGRIRDDFATSQMCGPELVNKARKLYADIPKSELDDLEMRERVNRHQIANEEFSSTSKVTRPKFEYLVWDRDSGTSLMPVSSSELKSELDSRGAEGWELCNALLGRYVFKREVIS